MADIAREQLDQDIARLIRIEDMLRHLADAIDTGTPESKSYPRDAIEALVGGADIVKQHRINSEEVRAIYDAKVHGISIQS